MKALGGFIASAIRLLIGSLGTALMFVGPEQKEGQNGLVKALGILCTPV